MSWVTLAGTDALIDVRLDAVRGVIFHADDTGFRTDAIVPEIVSVEQVLGVLRTNHPQAVRGVVAESDTVVLTDSHGAHRRRVDRFLILHVDNDALFQKVGGLGLRETHELDVSRTAFAILEVDDLLLEIRGRRTTSR